VILIAVEIGNYALDLKEFSSKGGFDELPVIAKDISAFKQPTLNAFVSVGYHVNGP
jgi:hypothetical protein